MNHSDNHLDGRLSDYVVVLIHSRPIGRIGAPLQLDQTDMPGIRIPSFSIQCLTTL